MKNQELKLLFVSVDPERDAVPARMARFLRLFDIPILGLTGSSESDPRLKNIMQKYRIYASKIFFEEDDKGDVNLEVNKFLPGDNKKLYTMDHTVMIYLVSSENEYLTHIDGKAEPAFLAK